MNPLFFPTIQPDPIPRYNMHLVNDEIHTRFSQIGGDLRRGSRITAHPANLVIAGVTLAAIVLVISAIIVDQYRCWIGVPNCD